MMKFYHRGNVPGWDKCECMEMYSCTIKSATSELQYVGVEIGKSGFILIQGGLP